MLLNTPGVSSARVTEAALDCVSAELGVLAVVTSPFLVDRLFLVGRVSGIMDRLLMKMETTPSSPALFCEGELLTQRVTIKYFSPK